MLFLIQRPACLFAPGCLWNELIARAGFVPECREKKYVAVVVAALLSDLAIQNFILDYFFSNHQ